MLPQATRPLRHTTGRRDESALDAAHGFHIITEASSFPFADNRE